MNWKWNNLLIFHKQNERHYWLGLLNILGLFKTKPEDIFWIFLNRTIHDKQKNSTFTYLSWAWWSFYWSQLNLKHWLTSQGNLQYLGIWRRTLLEHSFMSLPLLYLHGNLHPGFHLFLFWLFSYVHNTFLMQCLLLQRALLPNFSFPFKFLLKAGIFWPPTFVLYYLPTNFEVDIDIYYHHCNYCLTL